MDSDRRATANNKIKVTRKCLTKWQWSWHSTSDTALHPLVSASAKLTVVTEVGRAVVA